MLFIIFLILLISEIIYLEIALSKKIFDKPKFIGSNTSTTITGGSVIFILAVFLFFFYYEINRELGCFILSIFIVAVISFMDDLKPLSSKIRLGVHFIAVNIAFWGFGVFSNFSFVTILLVLGSYILTIGYVNIYNFMDGINGMIFLNASCSYITFYLINVNLIQFTNSNLIMILINATIVFGYFNFRENPKCFAGDVGSITMGFTIVFFTLKLFIVTKNILVFLILGIYSLDGGWTILERLYRKENIFKTHSRHLYELLTNQLKIPHLILSIIYALFQVILNLTVYLGIKNNYNSVNSFVIISICLSLLYILVKKITYKKTKLE